MAHPPDDEPSSAAPDATVRDLDRVSHRPARAAAEHFAEIDEGERYLVEAELGAGGMGLVTLCADRRINRRVAMKTLHERGDEDLAAAEARFFREARVQGQLEHPAIVPVYDLGRGADQRAFFTMKRVHGATLAEVLAGLARGDAAIVDRYPIHRLLAAFASICLAIDFAHRRGVIHRDLKPANVMLGDFGEVYVLDWGIARVLADVEAEPSLRAAPDEPGATGSSITGTLGYMSPEQLRGEPLSPASDVYALGALLFELLALEPLGSETTVSRQLVAILSGRDGRPSTRRPGAAIPPELDAICVRALAVAPAERYPSARALHEAVDGYLAGERDVALRKELAERHAGIAAAHLPRLATGSLDDRRQALRDVGRALALDPQNRQAFDTLVRILAEPPRQMPPEVEQQRLAEEQLGRQKLRRVGAAGFAATLAFAPLLLWAGVRSWTWALVYWGGAALLALLATQVGRRREQKDRVGHVMLLVSMVSFIGSGALFGPLLFTPGGVALTTFGFTLQFARERRGWPLAAAIGAVLLPLGAQALGLIPRSYAFADGSLIVHPIMVAHRPVPTLIFLVVTNLGLLLAAWFAASQARAARVDAERHNLLHRWHLAQLMPADAPVDAPRRPS